ncbi:threonine/serine exporter family protein [Rhodobacteraceae bacterium NNCM2]|nr:threonine/serine exporter family protein [Coraliihabitans acroporae]
MEDENQVSHTALRIGRLMLANGAGAERVQNAVAEFVRRFGYGSRVMVTAEGLILTLDGKRDFHTRLGYPLTGMGINMGVLTALRQIRRDVGPDAMSLAEIERQLDEIEHRGKRYPQVLVIKGMGLAAAALARLFGAEWTVVYVTVLVGMVTQSIRYLLGRAGTNPIAMAALTAFGGGLTGAVVMTAFPDASPTLCLVAAGMILVPGAPLINGLRDTFGNHVGVGINRLTLGAITIVAITFGLLLAAVPVGDQIPVGGKITLLPVGEDLLFSALAGVGYAFLFNVPLRTAWACVLCAMVGHGLRTWVMHQGFDLALGSLAGAFAAALLARVLAWWFETPPVAFAFPGVVSMIPGSFGFRAAVGSLDIMKQGAAAPASLVAETIGLAVTAMLVTAAISIGVCVALGLPSKFFPKTGIGTESK